MSASTSKPALVKGRLATDSDRLLQCLGPWTRTLQVLMVTLDSLRERFEFIDSLYYEHQAEAGRLQEEARSDLVPQLVSELSLDQSGIDRALAYLDDPLTVFRFYRKSHFNSNVCLDLLRKTLLWRLTSSLDLVSPSSLDPLYSEKPLLYLHPKLQDKFGRPSAILNMVNVLRPDDGSLDSLKEFIAFQLEVTRRYLADLSKRENGKPYIQIVFLLNLAGASFSNLEVELLPFAVDLLKNHFPGMVGAVYVLNYGWAYAGMWQVAKRVLPKVALERILFPTSEELFLYFDEANVLKEHGGTVTYKYRLSNNHILTKYGRASYYLRHRSTATPSHSAAPSPAPSRPLSRISSLESMHDTYYSLPNTPRMSYTRLTRSPFTSVTSLPTIKQGHTPAHHITPPTNNKVKGAPRWLDMTNVNEIRQPMVSSPRSLSPQKQLTEIAIPRVASIRDFRETLQDPAQKSLDQDYFTYETSSEVSEASDTDNWEKEALSTDDEETDTTIQGSSSLEPPADSERLGGAVYTNLDSEVSKRERADSIAQLRSQLSQGQPAPSNKRGRLSGTVSPYNATNPFYGYPAMRYVPMGPPSTVKLPVVRPYHGRRRKRDLIRTLSYLATLRLLAFNRKIRLRITLAWRYIWDLLWRWGAISSAFRRKSIDEQAHTGMEHDEEEHLSGSDRRRKRKGVHWAADPDATKAPNPLLSLLKKIVLFSPEKLFRSIPRWIVLLSALLFFRSGFFRHNARSLVLFVKNQAEKKKQSLVDWREQWKLP